MEVALHCLETKGNMEELNIKYWTYVYVLIQMDRKSSEEKTNKVA